MFIPVGGLSVLGRLTSNEIFFFLRTRTLPARIRIECTEVMKTKIICYFTEFGKCRRIKHCLSLSRVA